MEDLVLVMDELRGVYLPQQFAEDFLSGDISDWSGVSEGNLKALRKGPNYAFYWDAWDNLERDAVYHHEDGREFKLYLNGDLWLYNVDKVYLLDGLE